ncbi:DUF4113 domain-containing protein (plasmid) [Azospirillum baldaniorum]|nr:DUF4113 domain-containing protein [Azospirillum baldaniorum]NUB09037.1 DUF4113 domain-containing protein [Azospirillum baldaniorum]
MAAMDAINSRMGRDTLVPAATMAGRGGCARTAGYPPTRQSWATCRWSGLDLRTAP